MLAHLRVVLFSEKLTTESQRAPRNKPNANCKLQIANLQFAVTSCPLCRVFNRFRLRRAGVKHAIQLANAARQSPGQFAKLPTPPAKAVARRPSDLAKTRLVAMTACGYQCLSELLLERLLLTPWPIGR